MIQKIHFGKRVAKLRRGLGLSQAELGEKLGVSAQAVSKWECGTALPDLETLLELSHLFGATVNELLEGSDLLAKLLSRPGEYDGIHYFVKEEVSQGWAADMVEEGWVPFNWRDAHERSWPAEQEAAKAIAEHGGLILEIGAGPGGGFMPHVLKEKPEASIVISDLSPTVVREWKRLLDRELNSPNLSYAVFDFADMPFRDGSFDVVCDRGGIGNATDISGGKGDKGKALKEVYRVLKPGGLYVTMSGFVTRETLAALPEAARQVLTEKRPDIFESLYEETVLAGFRDIRSDICGHWDTDDDDSGIADLARELGVNVRFTEYVRYCVK